MGFEKTGSVTVLVDCIHPEDLSVVRERLDDEAQKIARQCGGVVRVTVDNDEYGKPYEGPNDGAVARSDDF